MNNRSAQRLAIILVLLGCLGVAGIAYYVKSTPQAQRVPDSLRVQAEPLATTTTPKERIPSPAPSQVKLLKLIVDGTSLSSEAVAVPAGQEPMTYVGNQTVNLLRMDGVQLLSVEVKDHVAILNFNEKLNSGLGSMAESEFASSLQTVYSQFKELDSVLVQVGGKPFESGHFDYSEPLPVTRPGTAPLDESSSKPPAP